jgi:hypothetical protein
VNFDGVVVKFSPVKRKALLGKEDDVKGGVFR